MRRLSNFDKVRRVIRVERRWRMLLQASQFLVTNVFAALCGLGWNTARNGPVWLFMFCLIMLPIYGYMLWAHVRLRGTWCYFYADDLGEGSNDS